MDASYPEQWANREFAYNYLEIADILVVSRRKSLDYLKSFYRYFLAHRKSNTIVDFGCGDGILTRELMLVDNSISAVLIDGSEDMLEKAREHLARFKQCQFINASFQNLMDEQVGLPKCSFAISSLAIHHLKGTEKRNFFKYIHSHLIEGGYFLNIDTIRSSSPSIEAWHLKRWREEVFEQKPPAEFGVILEETINKYTSVEHYENVETLESQMASLAQVGFKEVDCYFKQGMFVIYGGRKQLD